MPLRPARLALSLLPAVVALCAYAGLHVWWYADDFFFLYAAANGDVARALLLSPPGHFIPVWNAIRWLAFEIWGPNPVPLAILLLALHALNATLLALVVARWTSLEAGAVAGSVWAVASFHVGILGWLAA